jgi:hypothetical protein
MLVMVVSLLSLSAALAAEYNLVPNRLSQAKVGEWVVLGNVQEPGETVKTIVQAVECDDTGAVVVLRRETLDAEGKVTDSTERRVSLSRYQDRLDKLDQKADRISREKMLVKDSEITVYVVEWVDEESGREMKLWSSYAIPVGGFVKIWSSDPELATYEIVDFGWE